MKNSTPLAIASAVAGVLFFAPSLASATDFYGCYDPVYSSGTFVGCYFYPDHHGVYGTPYEEFQGMYPATTSRVTNLVGVQFAASFGVNPAITTPHSWYKYTLSDSGGTPTGDAVYVSYEYVGGAVWPERSYKGVTFTDSSAFAIGDVSTTSIAAFCDANVPFDDSTIIKATLTAIPNGLCYVGAFLVIPTSASLDQFTGLASTTKAKFPFSYVSSAADLLTTLQASSTQNAPEIALNFHTLGVGSTSPLGTIVPDVVVFSASTTKSLFPPGLFDTFKGLAAVALVLTLVADIFFSSKKMLK